MKTKVFCNTVCWIALLSPSTLSCNKKSSSTLTAASMPAPNQLRLPCKLGQTDLGTLPVKGLAGVSAPYQVAADWCFESIKSGKVRLLFIVDVSGSMRSSDPNCQRFESMRNLINGIVKNSPQVNSIEVGAVTFSTSAEVIRDFEFYQWLIDPAAADKFCLKQGSTNYGAAFASANDVVSRLIAKNQGVPNQAPVITFFITDGMPTDDAGAMGAIASGSSVVPPVDYSQGASKLRQQIASINDSSTLNAIYLVDQSGLAGGSSSVPNIPGGSSAGIPPFPMPPGSSNVGGPVPSGPSTLSSGKLESPEQILAGITGSADRVKTAANAEQLLGKLEELINKPAASVDPSSIQFAITTKEPPRACNPANKCQVIVNPNDSGKWQVAFDYATSDSIVQSGGGKLEITGKTVDGKALHAAFDISIPVLQ